MQTVIIFGAASSGKSRRAEQFRKHYGCTSIVDGWDGLSPLADGALAITNIRPPFNAIGAKVIPAERAKEEACATR